MVGAAVITAGIAAYTWFWAPMPTAEDPYQGVVHVDLDSSLISRIDQASPKLQVDSTSSTALVTVYRSLNGSTLEFMQFVGLKPARYQALVITWGDGTTHRIPISVNLTGVPDAPAR